MYTVVLLGFLALASAAPHYGHHHHDYYERYPHSFESDFNSYLRENIFDTRRFWNDLQRDMLPLNNMLAYFNKCLPSSVSSEKIEGNDYVITIPLTGCEVDEIFVKAKTGLLVIQAVHKYDWQSKNNYLDIRTLPDFVNEAGSWSFENDILKITFPLEKGNKTDTVVSTTTTTTTTTTDAPQHNRGDITEITQQHSRKDITEISQQHSRKGITKISQQHSRKDITYAVDLLDNVQLLPTKY